MRWWIVLLVALAGCTEIPSGPIFGDDAERLVILAGSDPCHEGICWAGGEYEPALSEAGIDLVLRLPGPPLEAAHDEETIYWIQERAMGRDIYAFDRADRWLHQVWNHTQGMAYDLQLSNGTLYFVTAEQGTPLRPSSMTQLWSWRPGTLQEVEVPWDEPFSLLAVGLDSFVLTRWGDGVPLHRPEAHLLAPSGWLETLVTYEGTHATVDAVFSSTQIFVAVNQWADEQYRIVAASPLLGQRSAVRGDSQEAALGLVAGPDRLAFHATTAPGEPGVVHEIRFSDSKETVLGEGQPAGYQGGALVVNRPPGSDAMQRLFGADAFTMVPEVPRYQVEGISVGPSVVLVRVGGAMDALAWVGTES